MSETDKPGGKRGRPAKGPMQGKGANFATRITADMRAALDEEAERTGRSVSQVAELMLERGRLLGDLGSAGPAVAGELRSMLLAAVEVKHTIGEPTKSTEARNALRERWVDIAKRALPYVEALNAATSAATAAVSAMRFSALAAYDELVAADRSTEITSADPGIQERRATMAHLLGIGALAETYPGSPDWARARSDIEAAMAGLPERAAGALADFLAIADAAERAVLRAGTTDERS